MNLIKQKDFRFSVGEHEKKQVIWISFDYDQEKIKRLKKINAKWSQSKKCWYVSDNNHYRDLFRLEKELAGKTALAKISDKNKLALQHLNDVLKLKAYSASTIKTYTSEFLQLLYVLKNVDVNSLSSNKLRSYFLYCINELKISENHLHSRLNAIKFYFEQVLKKETLFIDIPRPKKPSTLPKVLSQKDIEKIFAAVDNPKHLLMLQLCYGMGLRVGEVVKLKISDIDSNRMQVLIEAAKGKKDRYVNLPQSILSQLRSYYKQFKPKLYLFEGQYGGAYATRSVQTIFKIAMQKARVNKAVGVHGLRHSYATHLLEYGTDISFIQKLLGHNDIKTTQIYAKVGKRQLAQIVSPLDRM